MRYFHVRSLNTFINETMGEKQTTKQEELELSKKILSGDMAARETLVRRNMKFAWHFAKQNTGKGIDLEVLVQEVAIAMWVASEKFDATKGMKFVNWASYFAKTAIGIVICQIGKPVTYPKFNFGRSNARSIIDEMTEKLGRYPTNEEFHKRSGASGNICAIMKGLSAAHVYLDAPLDKSRRESDSTETRFVCCGPLPDKDCDDFSDKKFIESLLPSLDDRERMVIRRFFGLGGRSEETLTRIGKDIGISRERTRQIKLEALEKMQISAQRDQRRRSRKMRSMVA